MSTGSNAGGAGELAALIAAGALGGSDLGAAERALARDAGLRAELADLSPAVEALALAAGPVLPPGRVRSRLLEQIAQSATGQRGAGRNQVWKQWHDGALNQGLQVVRGDRSDWEETGVPGVRVRRLRVDRPSSSVTMLVQMDRGASYPRHQHNGPEECMVLRGDLHVGDQVMRAGDYQFAPPDTLHGDQWTEEGCLLYVTSSLDDEFLD